METKTNDDDEVSAARATVDALYRNDRVAQASGIAILDAAPGRVCLTMTVRAEMLNGHGTCHGGVLFAFADCAFAFACNSREVAMVGAGAQIEFLRPTPLHARLRASATELSRDSRHGLYDVVVTDATGIAVAHFRGRCARLRTPSATATTGTI